MADSYVRIPPDSTGKRVDAASLDVGVDTVYRQRIVLADNSATAQYATVTGGALLVQPNAVAISGTAQVAIATPFTVNNISATVTVAGTVNVNGGVAVSGTAQVAIGTPFTVNDISRTVQVAIATPFTINNISATVNVAGTFIVDTINAISRTVQVAVATPFTINNVSATVMVAITSGGGSGFSLTDGTPHTAQEAAFVPVGGVFDDAVPGTLSEGDAGVARITTNRALHINLRDASGNELGAASASGVFVRTATVVVAAGASNIGTINDISRTVQVAVGTPFTVNNISATVAVSGLVGLTAGTAVIGDINAISRTVQVAVGTPFTINNVSATVTVAGTVNLSATASVILAAGAANIGSINDISRTVQVAIGTPFTLQGISTTVNVAIATPFTVNNISASVLVATGATADFNTLASADQVQTLPIFGLALPASGGAVAGGTTANPVMVGGTINNISAAVTVSGLVGLTAGTAVIGDINAISRTVQVAVGTPFTINNISAAVVTTGLVGLTAGASNIGHINHISATVAVAIATPFTVNNISATVTVSGTVNVSATASVVLAAGTANIGTLNDISRTVQVAVATPFILQGISTTVTTVVAGFTPVIPSASHGPKTVTVSTSAVVVLVANPGTGLSVHITQLVITNAGTVSTLARVGTSATPSTVLTYCASGGGGVVMNFDPPWKLSASATAIASVKPNSSGNVYFMVNFYVEA